MNRASSLVLVGGLLLAACATPPPPAPLAPPAIAAPRPRPVAPALLPDAPSLVPSRLNVDSVVERLRLRLSAKGFAFKAPVRQAPNGTPPGSFAVASRILERAADSEPLCGGSAEIIQAGAAAAPTGGGTFAHLSCYTVALGPIDPGASACSQVATAGCPAHGDAVLAELSIDLISLQ